MGFIHFHTMAGLFIFGWLVIFPGLSSAMSADSDGPMENTIEITLRETNFVTQSFISLKDISDIRAGGFLKETLEKIEFGPSPKPDRIRFIDKKRIASVIRGQRYLPKDVLITGPERVYVKRLSRDISPLDVKNYTEERLAEIFKDKDHELTAFAVRGLEPYPLGKVAFSCNTDNMVNKNGRLSFFLDIVIDGQRAGRVSVSGLVEVFPLIRKGDLVSLYAQNDGLLIVTTGISREDGFENEVIQIENLNSGKIVRGIIKEKSKVEVTY